MAEPQRAGPNHKAKSTGEVVSDLIQLVKDYGRQETLDPLKQLGRFVAFGAAGSVALGVGLVLLGMALLRVLQAETGDAFDGNLSVVPYAIVLVVALVLIALAARAITNKPKGDHP